MDIPLMISSTLVSVENFWSSILVYHDRPHLVNRKLAAISPILFCKIESHFLKTKNIHEVFTWAALISQIRKLSELKEFNIEVVKNIVESHDKEALVEETNWQIFESCFTGLFLSARVLLPRKYNQNCIEVVIFDKEEKTVTFFAVQEQNAPTVAPRFHYQFKLTKEGAVRVNLNSFEDADNSSADWIADKLFPKILKWTENDIDNTIVKSLTLISVDDYHSLYLRLKAKYGDNIVSKWHEKAKTDPQKYVFEDVAIAAYLICLWQQKSCPEKINFVDCGCGNGLLVYILNKEGYKGFGLDIRRREVWDLYCNEADLRIGTITPESTFPGATWLIGNHSDELTPWIPIIALNSSKDTNYFVLPCCPFDLNGRKYVRLNTAVSQYADYLTYVEKISKICGFETSIDKLRIPSTKRTCLVGVREKITDSELIDLRNKVSDFVSNRLKSDFTPRNSVEAVRNCTKLNRDLIKRIVDFTVSELLKTECYIENEADGKKWNNGGTNHLRTICEKISKEDRLSLKKECGGFQTLLKNHRYIFCVKNGDVSLQKPLSLKDTSKYKDKPCWFQKNHPNGCFYGPESCAYRHSN